MAADVRNVTILSGSTNHKPVPVASVSAASPTTIHTTGAGIDEVFLWAELASGEADAWVSLFWGGTTDPTHVVCRKILLRAGEPPRQLINGLMLNGSLTISAWASAANVVNISGHVNRLS